MNNTRTFTALALMTGALALLPLTAASATAAEPTTDTAQSCWFDVDTETLGCFDADLDPIAQIQQETGADVVAVPTGSRAALATRSAGVAAAAADDPAVYLLATGYDAINYGGQSITYYTSNSAICNGILHGFPDLGSWNNRFDSLRSYNNCVTYLYDQTLLNGNERGPITTSADLGTFRNRAQSMSVE